MNIFQVLIKILNFNEVNVNIYILFEIIDFKQAARKLGLYLYIQTPKWNFFQRSITELIEMSEFDYTQPNIKN